MFTLKTTETLGGVVMGETIAVTARIPMEDKEKLDKLAMATGRTKGFLISKAIQDYLENQAWQIEEIRKGIQEADAGELATEEETEAFFARWKV
jgi:predicted transcriptional regulator